MELDLRKAEIKGRNAGIDLVAIFGGIDIKVPRHWKVEISGLPLFGGWDNKTDYTPLPDAEEKILIVKCIAMFGGVEIKN